MKKLINILKSQDGAALVLVLFLTTIIAISTSALLFNSFYSTENSVYGERKLVATQLAKGGVEAGLAYIEESLDVDGEFNEQIISQIGEDIYDIEITKPTNNTFSVKSTAKYQTAFGAKEVTYTINGNFAAGGAIIGGLESSFFESAAVTARDNGNASTFIIKDADYIKIDGDIIGASSIKVNKKGELIIINGDDGDDPYSTAEFMAVYNKLLNEQINVLYPFPVNPVGTIRYIDKNGNVTSEKSVSKITNLSTDSGRIVFMGDIYADELKIISDKNYDITFEGTVRVKKLTIENITGKMYFEKNLIVDETFSIKHANVDFIVNGVIFTDSLIYNGNNHSVDMNLIAGYIVAKSTIDINQINDIYVGGLAAPKIDIKDLNSINIINGYDDDGTNFSYNIINWGVQ